MPEACVDVLAMDALRWDGIPMDVFIWDGVVESVGEIELNPVTLCSAGGPLELLPPSQRIGCVLLGNKPAIVGGELACGAFREIRLQADLSLLWIARSSAATNEVTLMPWTGSGFDRATSYTACWDDPHTPISDLLECSR